MSIAITDLVAIAALAFLTSFGMSWLAYWRGWHAGFQHSDRHHLGIWIQRRAQRLYPEGQESYGGLDAAFGYDTREESHGN